MVRRSYKTLTSRDKATLTQLTYPHPPYPAKGTAFEADWTKHYNATSSSTPTLVVEPSSTEQVSKVLQYCQAENIAVIPIGGNTGLVGGTMPIKNGNNNEILLCTQRLNTIYSLNTSSGILHCQAGVVLQDLQTYAAAQQFLVPLDLGAKGSCCIGGTIATNAGGQYYYRYGSLAANLLGLQVVLADGRVLDLNCGTQTNLKDNTGYKIHQLFLGSEGTLGIVTAVALWCRPLLPYTQTALVACHSFHNVHTVLHRARKELGEHLAALEWMNQSSLQMVQATHEQLGPMPVQNPSDTQRLYAHYVLIETHGSNDEHQRERMERFLLQCNEDEAVCDGTIAQTGEQSQQLWLWRESCNPAAAASGTTYKYDVSLPDSTFDTFIEEMRDHLSSSGFGSDIVTIGCWGHLLDGNLHFNVTTVGCQAKSSEILDALEPQVFEVVHRRGGSISAEHGVGQAKARYMSMVKDESTLETMRDVKKLFDPKGILNPGKVLPT